jgi:hypothetical protein
MLAAILRLTALPNPSHCPRVEVQRTSDAIRLDFSGKSARQVIVVPLGLLGPADAEGEEIRLLANLLRMGYQTSRRSPEA